MSLIIVIIVVGAVIAFVGYTAIKKKKDIGNNEGNEGDQAS